MAEFTIIEALNLLEQLPEKIGKMGEEVMKEEFSSHTKSGQTIKTIHHEVNGNTIFIGSDAKGAYFVQNGRGAVRPVNASVLHWRDSGHDVFTMYAKPAKPDDFVGRTATRLRNLAFFK